MDNKLLVYTRSDSRFTSLRVYERDSGISPRFILLTDRLAAFLASEELCFYDRDMNNFLTITKQKDELLRVETLFLNRTSDKVTGRICEFIIARKALLADGDHLCDRKLRHIKRLRFSEEAHRLIATLDKRERRALSKALRDRFDGYNRVNFYRDIGAGFFFREEDGISGGLVMHSRETHGDIAYTFSVHT